MSLCDCPCGNTKLLLGYWNFLASLASEPLSHLQYVPNWDVITWHMTRLDWTMRLKLWGQGWGWGSRCDQLVRFSLVCFFLYFLFLFCFFYIYLLCIQYSVYMYACRPEEGTRSHYRWLWATMWLLGIELRTFGRAGNALNLWAISPAPHFI